jgi:hypothetical protein
VVNSEDLNVLLCEVFSQLLGVDHQDVGQPGLVVLADPWKDVLGRAPSFGRLGRPDFSPPGATGVAAVGEHQLILFELPLEAEIGEDIGPCLPNEGDGFFEAFAVLAHDIRDDEGGALGGGGSTREMPAAQWTRMLPVRILCSTRW